MSAPAEPPDYRYFNFASASHADVGYALGRADPPFKMQPWWARPAPPQFAQSCFDLVRELHPPLADEFLAYAHAQRLDSKTLWQMCCRVNLKAHIRASGHEEGEGCSTFAWYPAQTANDKPGFAPRKAFDKPGLSFAGLQSVALVGRNYDYWPMQARRQRIRFVPTAHAYASIGARGGVPGGRYDGINEHGLFASLHVVMTDNPNDDEVQPGVPFHLVARLALELCRTAREAADLLLHLPHLSSLNYLLADPHEAFVIEADSRCVRVLPMTGIVMAATNHFRHPDMLFLQGRRVKTNSECRLNFLNNAALAETYHDASLLDYAERIMADRTAPVCGVSGSLTTLWSCVAELGSGRIRFAPGAPGRVAYEEIEPLQV